MSEFAAPERIEKSAKAQRKRKKKLPYSGEGRVSEQDVATLELFGVQTIEHLNKKVEAFTKAHKDERGHNPTPDLTRDVIRAAVFEKDYQALVRSIPGRGQVARARRDLRLTLPTEQQEAFRPGGPSFSEDAAERARQAEVERTVDLIQGLPAFQELEEEQREQERGRAGVAQRAISSRIAGTVGAEDPRRVAQDLLEAERQARRALQLAAENKTTLAEEFLRITGEEIPPLLALKVNQDILMENSTNIVGQFAADTLNKYIPSGVQAVSDVFRAGVEGDPVSRGAKPQLVEMGFGSVFDTAGKIYDDLEIMAAYAPAGTIQILGAAGKDIAAPFQGEVPTNLYQIGKEVAPLLEDVVRNPHEYPADALLILWALTNAAWAIPGRVGAVSRSIALKQGKKEIVRSVFRRPNAPVLQMYGEAFFASDAAATAGIQKWLINRKMNKVRAANGPDTFSQRAGVYGLSRMDMPRVLDSVIDPTGARKATKLRQSAMRVEYQLAMHKAGELTRLAKNAAKADVLLGAMIENKVFGKWYRRRSKKTQLGIQKAIEIRASDDLGLGWRQVWQESWDMRQRILDDPARIARIAEKHNKSIEFVVATQKAQQFALTEARKVLETSNQKFVDLLEATTKLAKETERMRVGDLRLSEIYAQDRITRFGRAVRDDVLQELPAPRGLIESEIDKLQALVAERRVPSRSAQVEADKVVKNATERIAKRERDIAALEKKRAERGKPLSRTDQEELARLRRGNEKDRATIERNQEKARSVPGEEDRLTDAQGRPELSTARSPDELKIIEGEIVARIHKLQDAIAVDERGNLLNARLQNDPEGLLKELGFSKAEIDAQKEFIGGKPLNPEAFYFPVQRPGLKDRGPTRPGGIGEYGAAPPRDLPELRNFFSGESIELGAYRLDVSNLTAESYLRTVRAVQVKNDHDRLWAMATDKPSDTRYAIPIRDIRAIPDELKEISNTVDSGLVTEMQATGLFSPKQLDNLGKTLFPGTREKQGRVWRYKFDETVTPAEIAGGHVKWIDSRHIMNHPHSTLDHQFWQTMDRVFTGSFDVDTVGGFAGAVGGKSLLLFNEAVRDSTLFLRPAYALNAMGAGALSLFQQGPMAGVNLVRALGARTFYGPEVARWMDNISGDPKSLSFIDAPKSKITKPSRVLQRGWVEVTDKYFRRSAVIHELKRVGIRTPDQIRMAQADNFAGLGLTRKELATKILEVEERSNRAMVRFNSLNPFEQAVLRHVFFIYPWVKGSAVWSIHALLDRPIKTAGTFEIGHATEEDIRRVLGEVPDLFNRLGYWIDDEGQPSVRGSQFGAPQDAFFKAVFPAKQLVTGLFNLDPQGAGRALDLETLSEMYGGGFEVALGLTTGFSADGRRITNDGIPGIPGGGGLPGKVLMETAQGTPFGGLQRRAEKKGVEQIIGDPDPTNPQGLIEQERRSSRLGWFANPADDWEVWNPFIFGAASERRMTEDNVRGLNADFWSEQGGDAELEHHRDLLHEHLQAGAKIVGKPLPASVKRLEEWAFLSAKRTAGIRREPGTLGTGTTRERSKTELAVMGEMGLISEKRQKEVEALMDDPDATNQEIVAHLQREKEKVFDLEEVRDWWEEVGVVEMFRTRELEGGEIKDFLSDRYVPQLRKLGLGQDSVLDFSALTQASQSERTRYGREFAEFLRSKRLTTEATRDETLGLAERDQLLKDVRDLRIDQDEPVKINGKMFPSPEEMEWALKKPENVEAEVLALAKRTYTNMTRVEKKLFGRDVTNDVQRGWALYDDSKEIISTRDGAFIDSAAEKLAKQVDQRHPGFLEDWQFSRLSKAEKLRESDVFERSRFKNEWEDNFLKVADTYVSRMRQAASEEGAFDAQGRPLTQSDIRRAWTGGRVGESIVKGEAELRYEIVAEENVLFAEEVNELGGQKFVRGLLSR